MKSLFDKLWDSHVVVQQTAETPAILYIDLHLIHEVTSPQAFDLLRERGLTARRPDRTLATMDHSTPTTPEEDWQLMVPSFHALSFELAYGLGEYGSWLQSEADMVWAYSEFKQRLQIILHQRPRQQLVLKCPDHLWFIDSLLKVFPDACVVQTHRDPVRCITSYTSMISLQERTLTGRIRWKPLAKRLTNMFLHGAHRAQEARARLDANQFYDAQFDDLVRDPAAEVRKISDHFQLPAPCDTSMTNELAKPRSDRPGAHRYSYERLGIEPEEPLPQTRGDRSQRHRRTWMARVCGLDRVHGKSPNGVNAELIHLVVWLFFH